MDIVVVGHVDHGKSTVVGRLLADTHSLPDGKLEAVRAHCRRNSRPFEFAFLLDAMRDEQSQGITIDSARIFFKTQTRKYTLIDAPGHIEFLKNMVSGAARAEAALLVIDGKEGIKENSRRHGYILALLGVTQVGLLINKMDLLNFDQKAFETIRDEFNLFLTEIGIVPLCSIPVAGILGENIASRSLQMNWYHGPTVIEALDSFTTQPTPENKSFRMPVQDVYKFTKGGDARRIVAGSIECGTLAVGDEVIFLPSHKKSTVKSIEGFHCPQTDRVAARSATGFTLTDQIFIGRGELAARVDQANPIVTTRIRASLFWLGKEAMTKNRSYVLKLGTAKTGLRLREIIRIMDSSSLEVRSGGDALTQIGTNDVAECVLEFDRPLAVDLAMEFIDTGRFVVLQGYDICGGGLVREVLQAPPVARTGASPWSLGRVTTAERAIRYQQRSTLTLLTGTDISVLKAVAEKLESDLFGEGRFVILLGAAEQLVSGDSANLDHILERFIETANVLLQAGLIVIGTLAEMTQERLEGLRASVAASLIETIQIGHAHGSSMNANPCRCDLQIDISKLSTDEVVSQIRQWQKS